MSIFESTVPFWFLKVICGKNGAPRLKPRPLLPRPRTSTSSERFHQLSICGVCLSATTNMDRRVTTDNDGRRRCFHNSCFEKRFRGEQEVEQAVDTSGVGWEDGREQLAQIKAMYTNDSPGVPEGNLGGGLYRYFVGSQVKNTQWAQCRACRRVFQSTEEMQAHKKWMDPKANLPCMFLLTAAFKMVRNDPRCIICNTGTHNTRYDLPICGPRCEKDWKFKQEINPIVAVFLEKVRNEAVRQGLTL
jgi:hypothetical protein